MIVVKAVRIEALRTDTGVETQLTVAADPVSFRTADDFAELGRRVPWPPVVI